MDSVLHTYLEKGKTINIDYYPTLLAQLNYVMKPNYDFYCDNVPTHTSSIAVTKFHKLHFKLSRALYLSGLVSSMPQDSALESEEMAHCKKIHFKYGGHH